MIQLYALLYFNLLLRQNTTAPPQNLNEWVFLIFMFVLIQGGGLGIIWLVVKTRNDVWQKRQEAKIAEDKAKSDNEAARAKADAEEGSAIASALVPLISQNGLTLELFGRLTQLSAEANALLKSHADMVKNFNEEQIKARALWHSSMETKMTDLEESIVNRAIGDTETLTGIKNDIAAVKTDLDEKVESILSVLKNTPTVKGHQEATRQITDMLSEIKAQLAMIESRLPAVEPTKPPVTDGPALAADGKPEAKPPEVTQ